MDTRAHRAKWLFLLLITLVGVFFPVYNGWTGCSFYRDTCTLASAIAGILPYSDSKGYFEGAFYINDVGSLTGWNTRRPLVALYDAFLLRVCSGNFYTLIFAQALTLWVALLFVARLAWLKKDFIFAILFVIPLVCFAQTYSPTCLSETYGLALGCLSFVVLWQGWSEKNPSLFSLALFLFTLALTARSGPFFILPMLILLAYVYPLSSNPKLHALGNIAAILAGVCIPYALSKFYGDSSGAFQSNFAPTVFGLVTGGKSWLHVYSDPLMETLLRGKSEAEASRIMYQQSWQQFQDKPYLLVWGLLKGILGLFKYIFVTSSLGKRFISIPLIAYGAYRFFKNRQAYPDDFKLILFSLIGIIASASIIWTDGGRRVFAVSIPLIALLFAYSFAPLSRITDKARGGRIALQSAALFGLLLFVSLFNIQFFSGRPESEERESLSAKADILTPPLKNVPFIIVSNFPQKRPPFLIITPADFKRLLELGEKVADFGPLMQGEDFALGLVYDYKTGSATYIMIDPDDLLKGEKLTGLTRTGTTGIVQHVQLYKP